VSDSAHGSPTWALEPVSRKPDPDYEPPNNNQENDGIKSSSRSPYELAGVGQHFPDTESQLCQRGPSGQHSGSTHKPASSKRKRDGRPYAMDSNEGGDRDADPERDEDDDDDEDEDEEERDRKRACWMDSREPDKTVKKMACLFYRLNPLKHGDCGKYVMKNARRVKQHLLRVHCQPDVYCPTCGKVWARDKKELMHRHIRERSCKHREVKLEGITEEQRGRLLGLKSSRGTAEDADQWFSMWNILFPEKQRPDTDLMHMGGPVSEALLVVQAAIRLDEEHLLCEIFPNEPVLRSDVGKALPAVLDALRRRHQTALADAAVSRLFQNDSRVTTSPEPLNPYADALAPKSRTDITLPPFPCDPGPSPTAVPAGDACRSSLVNQNHAFRDEYAQVLRPTPNEHNLPANSSTSIALTFTTFEGPILDFAELQFGVTEDSNWTVDRKPSSYSTGDTHERPRWDVNDDGDLLVLGCQAPDQLEWDAFVDSAEAGDDFTTMQA